MENNCADKMSVIDILRKKMTKEPLSQEEIQFFVKGAVLKTITQSQIGAMLMAICINGMTDTETQDLTEAMIESGSRLTYPAEWRGTVVGKHSTGGVGDKVSLILVPALAACGLRVPKITGRGLGHTGGTMDKLESVPGFRGSFAEDEIVDLVQTAGCCQVCQTNSLVPADKVLYGIRDTTATVESIPLVAGSVMSKKAVESLDALVLEVTFGKAALVKTEEDGRRLATTMIATSKRLKIKTTAVLTRMHNPLGKMIGNALEIAESVDCLNGRGPKDVLEVVCLLGAYLLVHTGKAQTIDEGSQAIRQTLEDGSARDRFAAMLHAQGVSHADAASTVSGGDAMWSVLPKATHVRQLVSHRTGYVQSIDAYTCGNVVRHLGAGREKPGDVINPAVGMELLVQVGDHISTDEPWAKIHSKTPLPDSMAAQLQTALALGDTQPRPEDISPIAGVLQ